MDPRVRASFRAMMEAAMPAERPGAFNQALMDLGAMVCLPNGAPECGRCPLAGLCEANRLGMQSQLPVRRKKAARRVEEMTVYLLVRRGRIALRRRADAGLLAGLWEFPHVPGILEDEEAGRPLADWGLSKHIFTHVEWHMAGYLLEVEGDGPDFTWADRAGLEALAVPSAFGKFLEEALRALGKEAGQ